MENFMRFKLFGAPIKLKKNARPRFFDCQPDRRMGQVCVPRKSYVNLQQKKNIQEILEKENVCSIGTGNDQPSTSKQIFNMKDDVVASDCNSASQISPQSSDQYIDDQNEGNCASASFEPILKEKNINVPDLNVEEVSVVEEKKNVQCTNAVTVSTRSIGVSVHLRPKFRSVGIMCKLSCVTLDKCCGTSDLDDGDTVKRNDIIDDTIIKNRKKVHTPEIDCGSDNLADIDSDLNNCSLSETPISGSEYKPSSGEIQSAEECDLHIKRTSLKMISYYIANDPKRYMGVPPSWLWILEKLHIALDINIDDIKLILMKIKLNDTYVLLGNQFGMSSVRAGSIFNNNVMDIADVLDSFVFFPSQEKVMKNMPVPFRPKYHQVEAIIDAFEIEIEQPSNVVHQSQTWSDYKKCNTLKYLVSCSPDGVINFISKGYGGRISDSHLFEISGIMEHLPEGCTVMADRGFKQIDTILFKKKCKLVRPPSVAANQKLSKEEAKEAKRIASLRIHIERVIGRLREFKMLDPNAGLSHYMMPYIDSVVSIAASLTNFQSPIIKT